VAVGSSNSFDLIVLGAGTGGYSTAFRAAQMGLRTALVEEARIGGTCLHWGCIPTKAMLESADLYARIREATAFGLTVGETGVDMGTIAKRRTQVVERLTKGLMGLVAKNQVQVSRLQDGDLGEVAVHVQTDEAHGSHLPAAVVLIGAAGQHDTYGSALTAHPGESQGRPRTNASSQLTSGRRPAQSACPRRPCPGWSHHTPRGPGQTDVPLVIPGTNPLERLNKEIPVLHWCAPEGPRRRLLGWVSVPGPDSKEISGATSI